MNSKEGKKILSMWFKTNKFDKMEESEHNDS
jgi:hypothetical protein